MKANRHCREMQAHICVSQVSLAANGRKQGSAEQTT